MIIPHGKYDMFCTKSIDAHSMDDGEHSSVDGTDVEIGEKWDGPHTHSE